MVRFNRDHLGWYLTLINVTVAFFILMGIIQGAYGLKVVMVVCLFDIFISLVFPPNCRNLQDIYRRKAEPWYETDGVYERLLDSRTTMMLVLFMVAMLGGHAMGVVSDSTFWMSLIGAVFVRLFAVATAVLIIARKVKDQSK
jgi:uncharacterized membrane protein